MLSSTLLVQRLVRSAVGHHRGDVTESGELERGFALLARGTHDAYRAFREAVAEDHRIVARYGERYDARLSGPNDTTSKGDFLRKIGLQIMVAYRVMRFFRAAGLTLGAQLTSRAIRHAYGSDLHWDAELEPGVMIVHGFGLAVSYAARVAHGCILFQNVSLGFGRGSERHESGAPKLEEGVHVGIGATLYGPIVVGAKTKVMAGCVLSRSVPANSIVAAPSPEVRKRAMSRA